MPNLGMKRDFQDGEDGTSRMISVSCYDNHTNVINDMNKYPSIEHGEFHDLSQPSHDI